MEKLNEFDLKVNDTNNNKFIYKERILWQIVQTRKRENKLQTKTKQMMFFN